MPMPMPMPMPVTLQPAQIQVRPGAGAKDASAGCCHRQARRSSGASGIGCCDDCFRGWQWQWQWQWHRRQRRWRGGWTRQWWWRRRRREGLRRGVGSYFGERALLHDEVRGANVRAAVGGNGNGNGGGKGEDEGKECLVPDREHFDDLLGPLRQMMLQRQSRDRISAAESPSAQSGEATAAVGAAEAVAAEADAEAEAETGVSTSSTAPPIQSWARWMMMTIIIWTRAVCWSGKSCCYWPLEGTLYGGADTDNVKGAGAEKSEWVEVEGWGTRRQ